MFDRLPTELRLKTLAPLDVHDLHNAQRVSRSWQAFFIANESSIYRHAAAVHGFSHNPQVSLAEVKSASPRGSMTGVESWKDLIRRRFRIEANWQGRTQPRVKEFRSSGDAVHRIKIDEEEGYIITTSSQGGLRVTDLYRNEVLWSLPEDYVCELAHCEYGAGYIIFNRLGNAKEVWRRAGDFHDVSLPTQSLPDELQLRASADAAELHYSNTLHGHFLPWALIELPIFGRAFRFVHPYLLVAAENQACIWNITTMDLITIHDTQMPVEEDILGHINYVEMNERYVIICGSKQLRIFSKQGALLYHIPACKSTYANSVLGLTDKYEHGTSDMVLIPRATSAHTPRPPPSALLDIVRYDDFVAAHITPCGSVLVALMGFGRVVIVGNLERVVAGEVALEDAAAEVHLHSSPIAPDLLRYSTYLALEEGRIAAATRGGIYVITLNNRAHGIIAPQGIDTQSQGAASTPFPDLTICQAICFDNPSALFSLSCLQITASRLFVTWKPDARLSVMLQSPGHQPSLDHDAPQQSLLVDEQWDVDEDQINHLGPGLPSGFDFDGAGSVFTGVGVLAYAVQPNGSPTVPLAGPSTQPLLGGEQEDTDDYMPDLHSVSDSSSEDSGDQLEDLRAISTVICMDFLPE